MSQVLMIKSDFDRFSIWEDAFADFDLTLLPWNPNGRLDDVDYALVWQPEPGVLAKMSKLKVIFSIGAGLDHLKPEGCVPPNIPVVRMVEEQLTAGMVEFVLFHVLRYHRFMDVYERNQQEGVWSEKIQVSAANRRVGILGLGELGGSAAQALSALGFAVHGWSRTEKCLPKIKSYFGEDQLQTFLSNTDILVCLLPLTDATRDIVNQQSLAALPKGAYFINAGRGGQVDEEALLAALDSGQLSGAALDVFKAEPLPSDSRMWNHPKVYVTPHIASMTTPASSSRHVIDNIKRCQAGEPLTHQVDLSRGY